MKPRAPERRPHETGRANCHARQSSDHQPIQPTTTPSLPHPRPAKWTPTRPMPPRQFCCGPAGRWAVGRERVGASSRRPLFDCRRHGLRLQAKPASQASNEQSIRSSGLPRQRGRAPGGAVCVIDHGPQEPPTGARFSNCIICSYLPHAGQGGRRGVRPIDSWACPRWGLEGTRLPNHPGGRPLTCSGGKPQLAPPTTPDRPRGLASAKGGRGPRHTHTAGPQCVFGLGR